MHSNYKRDEAVEMEQDFSVEFAGNNAKLGLILLI